MRDEAIGGRVLSWRGGSSSSQAAGEDPLATPPARHASVIWHDVECGAYAADLSLWEELASDVEGPILDLGCGTGRVALHLARQGHEVTGLDADAALLAALGERAAGLPVRAELGDARGFELEGEFGLVLAPMQLVQLLANKRERIACLSCVASHVRPGGRVAMAIIENVIGGANGRADGSIAKTQVAPDVHDADGWIYSSLPLETVAGDEEIVVRRLRQTVSPQGELDEEVDEVRLRVLNAATLEHEAEAAGLRPTGRRFVPDTDAHVGSAVVLLEAP